MTMMSRPIIKKKIKRNNVVYNLELWNTIDDDFIPNVSEPPQFRKDFFNDVAMDGKWPDSTEYQERFDDWFDNLSKDKQIQYARAIDESNRIIILMVWEQVNKLDKHELFNNNIRQFSIWFSGLDPADIDFYMTRIMSKRRLMPAEFRSDSPELLSAEEITNALQGVYDSINDDLIRATTINGLLCISCTDESRLAKVKKHMIMHGSILRDYRKKENISGNMIYTYIFSKP